MYRIPLRLLLPITIALFTLLVILTAYLASRSLVLEEVWSAQLGRVHTRINQLQGGVERFLLLNHPEGVNQLLSSLASEPDLGALFIVDQEGVIRFSTRYEEQGIPWREAGAPLDPELVEQVSDTRVSQVLTDGTVPRIHALASICDPRGAHTLRPGRCGFLYYQLDLEGHQEEAIGVLREQTLLILQGVLVGSLLFWGLIHLLVTRRVALLVRVLERVRGGERTARLGMAGSDELASVGQAVDAMLERLHTEEEALRASENRFRTLASNLPGVVYRRSLDPHWTMEYISPPIRQVSGYPAEEFTGNRVRSFASIIHPGDADRVAGEVAAAVAAHQPFALEYRILDATGQVHWVQESGQGAFDAQGNCLYLDGFFTDYTERKRIEDHLLLSRKVIESANEAIVITDLKGVIQEVNSAYETITGYSRQEVVGLTPAVAKSGRHDAEFYQTMWEKLRREGNWEGEIWDRRKSGEVYPKWLSINTVQDHQGHPTHYVGIFSDITEQKRTERKLENLAYYDPLTTLPNRALFRERLHHELATAHRHHQGVALFFIDLDRFKYVNDTLGHASGDELLQIVARRLLEQVRESDTVARLGGDEFTVILTDVSRPEQVSPIAQGIIDSLREPITLQEQEVRIGASVGIALYPDDGTDFDTLTKHADMAMYLAKERGRNNHQFFSDELQARIVERITLEDELGKALEHQELRLHFQPKFRVTDRRIVGMESLVRWEKPGQGLVSPAKFIPLAEETGLILPLGEWILEHSCRQAVAWAAPEGCPLQVAVNLSARQFQQPDLIQRVQETLERTALPPHCLELEITESMLMGNVEESIAIMRRLRELGLGLAMDDFGTGYSSLSYLKRFPVNTLKIDQSFVRDLTVDSSDAAIVRSIIGLARSLELKVVAEGVENAQQLEFLREHGCDQAQGYHLSRPLDGEAFARFAGLVPDGTPSPPGEG